MILTLIKQQIKMLKAPQLITATQHTDNGKITNRVTYEVNIGEMLLK